jgi:sirohydrochlorin cobaltochelatase
MKKFMHIMAVGCLLTVFLVGVAIAGGHGEKPKKKEAILMVVFGTSVPEAMKAFDGIEEKVKKAFPGLHLQWAYTSKIIRDKLRKEGKNLDDPVVALGKLLDDNYTHIVVASFHTLPGAEFHDLCRDVAAFRTMSGMHGRRVLVSRPLLASRDNMERTVKALLKNVPKSRKPADAVVFMGHGSEHHPGDAVYAAMSYWAQDIDPRLYIGTVEGQPQLQDIVSKLKKTGVKKVYLMPFMLVAGDHARNDMCGDEDDSWKSVLKKEGFTVECVLKGTGEMPEVVDIWVENIKQAHSHF